ncbi:MAG: hypothetical protein QY307_10540 [Acidimicrobiia bacterium]|nr:MAG: hypothetical protein QY307_10540 [Acidimicrobiia bacterium]
MLHLLAQIPVTIPENAEEIIDQVKENPVLAAILLGVGLLTAFVFVWGITKQAFKAAIFGGLLSAAAWYWYFNVR